jgi:creatinine amidohydrolase
VVFPNVASRRYARRLGVEFASGACHAGAYETSMVLAMAPALVDEGARAPLPEVPIDLARAMRSGATTFREAGGVQAYFGAPAVAVAVEGEAWLEELGAILAEAILAPR